jgi:hypothetical protein
MTNPQTVVTSVITLLIGVVLLFYGYPIFRVLLPLAGLVFGYYFGQNLFPSQPAVAFIAAIALAILFGILAYSAWSLLITISGALVGFGIGTQLAFTLGLDQTGRFIAGIVLSLVIGLLAYQARDLMVMVQTALLGAGTILFGIGALYEPMNILGTARSAPNGLALIGLLVLAAIGFFFQYSRFGQRHIYYRRR